MPRPKRILWDRPPSWKPRPPMLDEVWEDGRSWDQPPFTCWLLGHDPIQQFSKDLAWTFPRCLRCRCRGPVEPVTRWDQ